MAIGVKLDLKVYAILAIWVEKGELSHHKTMFQKLAMPAAIPL